MEQERQFRALVPLSSRPIDRRLVVNLEGDMAKYVWKLNGREWPNVTPLPVRRGERVEMVFVNKTMMAHPMHFHGHVFQVTEIAGQTLSGAKRDTVMVLPKQTVKVQFDADAPGVWMLHCHILYHEFGGMATTVQYEGFPARKFRTAESPK
jgi:FtsP/CotA-like multicopper oxidase with cupredoxin domain